MKFAKNVRKGKFLAIYAMNVAATQTNAVPPTLNSTTAGVNIGTPSSILSDFQGYVASDLPPISVTEVQRVMISAIDLDIENSSDTAAQLSLITSELSIAATSASSFVILPWPDTSYSSKRNTYQLDVISSGISEIKRYKTENADLKKQIVAINKRLDIIMDL